MPENPREKLYNNLLSTKKVTPDEIGDFQTFDKMLDTPDGATKLHSNLIKNGIATEDQIGDVDTFSQQVKKKKKTQNKAKNFLETIQRFLRQVLCSLQKRVANFLIIY